MTSNSPTSADAQSLLLALEAQRCSAMKRADLARLREIVHPDLTHVHAKGETDDYESYFRAGVTRVNYQQVERSEMKVEVLGDAALMTGRQLLVAEFKDGSGTLRIDSRVMQVWARHEGHWRQLAFQSTPLEMSLTR